MLKAISRFGCTATTRQSPALLRVAGLALVLFLMAQGAVVAQDAPSIDYVTPTGGPEGTQVRIIGSGLATGNVSATIGGRKAEIVSVSDSELVLRVASGTSTGELVVGTSAGTVTADGLFSIAPISIEVTPRDLNLLLGESAALSVAVSGTPNAAVDWSVNGVRGGDDDVGRVIPGTPTVYTAPAVLPASESQVIISAAAVADPAIKSIARVTLIDPAQGVPAIRLPRADMADFDLDVEIWQPISRTRIMIALAEGATIGDLAPQLAAMQAKVIGGLPEIDTVFVAIPDTGRLDAVRSAVATLGALSSVESAAHDSLVGPTSLPELIEDEVWLHSGGTTFSKTKVSDFWTWEINPSGGNWGYEYANFPQAWNLYDYAQKQGRSVEVGVTDTVIYTNHRDLSGIVTVQPAGFGDAEQHGTHVAATIGGEWDDQGINGASPFVSIISQPGTTGAWSTWGQWFTSVGDQIFGQIDGILRNRPNVRVINSSQGYPLLSGYWKGVKWDRSDPADGDYTDPGDICTDNSAPPNGNCTDPGDVCTDRSGDGDCDDLLPDIDLDPKFRWERDPPPAGPKKLIDAPSTPENNPVFQAFVRSQGIIARRSARAFPDVIIVIAAGNERHTFAPGDLHSNITGAAANRAAQWATISAEFGDAFLWAAYNGATNILAAEALAKTSNRDIAAAERTDFSSIAMNWPGDVFGFAAPGKDVLQAIPVSLAAPAGVQDAYKEMSGTSMAAPHLTGLIAYLYAMDPDLTVPQIMRILRRTSQAAVNAAPVIDAFAATLYIDEIHKDDPNKRKWIKKALLNIDDGTIDGNDRNVAGDEKGTGLTPPQMRINMSDFRRFRDAFLLALGRTAYFDGDVESLKRDLNGDKILKRDVDENIYPRADFNGDGVVSPKDLEVLADPGLWNDEQIDDAGMTPEGLLAELNSLTFSGDIKLDADRILKDPDVDNVKVTAKVEIEPDVFKSYSLTLTETDIKGDPEDKRKILTLPSDKPIRIWATAYMGSDRKYFLLPPDAPEETDIHEGQDLTLSLSKVNVKIEPNRIKASYDDSLVFDVKLTLEDTSVSLNTDYFNVSFTVPNNLGLITQGADRFSLSTKSIPGDYRFEAAVQTTDGDLVNPYDEPRAIGDATVRTAVIQEPGGMALDSIGNLYVTDSQAGTVTFIPPGGVGQVILSGLDRPGDVEVDALGRSLIVAEADGKVGRYFFGLKGTVKNAAENRITGAFVYVETLAGTIPGDATPENAFKTSERGEFHVPGLLAPVMGADPVDVVVTISYRGASQAFPVTLETVGPTIEEFVLD